MKTDNEQQNASNEEPQKPVTSLQLYGKSIGTEYTMKLQEIENDYEYSDIVNAFQGVIKDKDSLVIDISSPGGNWNSFLILWSEIARAFRREKITTRVPSFAFSGGAFMFMMGTKRVMAESALLMYHNYQASGLSGTSEEIREDLDVMDFRISTFFQTYLQNRMPNEVYDRMLREDLPITVKEACEYDLCTHVDTLAGLEMTAEEYLKCTGFRK